MKAWKEGSTDEEHQHGELRKEVDVDRLTEPAEIGGKTEHKRDMCTRRYRCAGTTLGRHEPYPWPEARFQA